MSREPGNAQAPSAHRAAQPLVGALLPPKTPNLFSSCAPAHAPHWGRHNPQLIPCPGWVTISILSQKVGAIIQESDVGTIRHGHQLVIHGVAGGYGRKLEGDLVGEIWL